MSFRLYKSYNFVDKDPIIDRLRTIISDEGVTYQRIHEDSGVALGTLSNWFTGPTRRPTHATVMAVLHALGYEYAIVKKAKSKAGQRFLINRLQQNIRVE